MSMLIYNYPVYFELYALREKCPNTELFLVRIQENTDQKQLRSWTLFLQSGLYITDVRIEASRLDYHLFKSGVPSEMSIFST